MPDHYTNLIELRKNRLIKLQESKGLCGICGRRVLIVHHLDGSRDNHSLENLVATCLSCHAGFHPKKKERISYKKTYGATLRELAAQLNVSYGTVATWHQRGQLPAALYGGHRPKARSKFRRIYGLSLKELASRTGLSISHLWTLHQQRGQVLIK